MGQDSGILSAGNELLTVGESLGAVAEGFDHSVAPGLEALPVGGLRGQVVALVRVGDQVEELLAAVEGAPDVFRRCVDQIVVGLFLAVAGGVFAVQIGTSSILLTAQGRDQAAAVDTFGNGRSGKVEESGHQVFQADRLVEYLAGFQTGSLAAGDDERDAGGAFVRLALAEHVVVAEHFAVVRGVDDDGVAAIVADAAPGG